MRPLPEADPFNFLPRVTIPILMLNGRYDDYYPLEESQKPLFRLLGTAPDQKRQLIYESGHLVPWDQLRKETLASSTDASGRPDQRGARHLDRLEQDESPPVPTTPRARRSNRGLSRHSPERVDAGDGLAEDQRVHLVRCPRR